MKRDLELLASRSFDLVVVGGGVLGAFVAWRAARRGLAVAVVERDDFGCATTAGCGKVLHGGLRYLRRPSLPLALEARREQRILRDLGGELVRPMGFLVPASSGRPRERLVLGAAAAAWRALLTADGDLPPARLLSAAAVREREPRLAGPASAGGLLFHDYQIRSPERFTLAVLRESHDLGATLANHAEATGLWMEEGRVKGVRVRDRLGEEEILVRAPVVVNATGPWTSAFLRGCGPWPHPIAFGKGIHLVTDIRPPAVGMVLPWRDPTRGGEAGPRRNLFVTPWEGLTLIGATYEPFRGASPAEPPLPGEVEGFVRAIRAQLPYLELTPDRVLHAFAGLYPVFGSRAAAAGGFDASLHPLLVDHARIGGPRGLVTAVSVKLTTARAFAGRVLAAAERHLERRPGREPPLPVGPLRHARMSPAAADGDAAWSDPARLERTVEVAVGEEMARSLADLVYRRTHLGHGGLPEEARLREVARAMAGRLGWSAARVEAEIDSVLAPSPRPGPAAALPVP